MLEKFFIRYSLHFFLLFQFKSAENNSSDYNSDKQIIYQIPIWDQIGPPILDILRLV